MPRAHPRGGADGEAAADRRAGGGASPESGAGGDASVPRLPVVRVPRVPARRFRKRWGVVPLVLASLVLVGLSAGGSAAAVGPRAQGGADVRVEVVGTGLTIPGVEILEGRTWVPVREACLRVLRGGTAFVPLRALVEATGGRIHWDPSQLHGAAVRVLSPWPIRRQLPGLRRELERIDAAARDPQAADEVAARRMGRVPWTWLLYLDRPGWVRGPRLSRHLKPWHVMFWGEQRVRFVARVVDKGFGLDRRDPYAEGDPPALDALVFVDLTAPAGEEVQWVAYPRPGAQGIAFPALDPFLEAVGLGMVEEYGTRPAIAGRLRAWAQGPGLMVPVAP